MCSWLRGFFFFLCALFSDGAGHKRRTTNGRGPAEEERSDGLDSEARSSPSVSAEGMVKSNKHAPLARVCSAQHTHCVRSPNRPTSVNPL